MQTRWFRLQAATRILNVEISSLNQPNEASELWSFAVEILDSLLYPILNGTVLIEGLRQPFSDYLSIEYNFRNLCIYLDRLSATGFQLGFLHTIHHFHQPQVSLDPGHLMKRKTLRCCLKQAMYSLIKNKRELSYFD